MKNLFVMTAMVAAALAMSSCANDADLTAVDVNTSGAATRAAAGFGQLNAINDYDRPSNSNNNVPVSAGNLVGHNHWTSANVYALQGVVRIPAGSSLTIDPGTIIVNSNNKPSVLVVAKGGQLFANGTPESPIIFTSDKMVDGKDNLGRGNAPMPGDFGGVVLLGNAPINRGSAFIEGLPETSEYAYGGSVVGDSSGSLTYVRIEYAGYELETDVEINGLTCGGVGNGTTLSHIQVSMGLDDSFEFFGGTVDADHLISYAHDDDGFDFDFGYTGTIEYGLDLANNNSTHSPGNGAASDSNGIELDNNAQGSGLTPITHPTLRYVAVVGTGTLAKNPLNANENSYKFGARIRRNGQITMENSVVTGYHTGISFDPTGSTNYANPALSFITNTNVHGFTAPYSPGTSWTGVTNPSAAPFGMDNPFFTSDKEGQPVNGADYGAPAFPSNWSAGWTLLPIIY